jgi:hypothetical protein
VGGTPEERTAQTACEPGHYCTGGIKTPCPRGRYGADAGLASAFCTEACPAGRYCPEASVTPQICPAGRYGAVEGLWQPGCSGPCDAGHFCLAGTADPRQHECGDEDVFCPEGSSAPTPVSTGSFSVGGGRRTRHGQQACDPNSGFDHRCARTTQGPAPAPAASHVQRLAEWRSRAGVAASR